MKAGFGACHGASDRPGCSGSYDFPRRTKHLDPTDARFAVALGLTLERLDRREEARQRLHRAAARVDDPTFVLLTLIEMHSGDENWSEAIARANRLIALHPTDPRYPDLLARLEEGAGR